VFHMCFRIRVVDKSLNIDDYIQTYKSSYWIDNNHSILCFNQPLRNQYYCVFSLPYMFDRFTHVTNELVDYRSNINSNILLYSKQNRVKVITLNNTVPYTLELFQIFQKSFPGAQELMFIVAPVRCLSDNLLNNEFSIMKKEVQKAIVVISRAIYLFKGLYPGETGCLKQILTGEGKSIIVTALACHRVDVITSSNVLAIRDSKEFQSFFQMFDLNVSNNCDIFYEQEPIDIVYGECSCFERDILLTEFNKNDPEQNIIGQRMSNNSISSVIIDEVDSMLLDNANMVFYLSHNIDTLKSLERIFISIWQTINQTVFDSIDSHMIDDDIIELVSNIIFEQIENKNIEILEYETYKSDYINMKLFVKRRMSIWIQSAFHVRDMTLNDTYIVSQDKSSSKSDVQITVMDKDTGTEQTSTRWSNGVHQFLQLKHMRRITPESLKAVFISNMSFFKRYKNHIIGLTDSLGSFDEQLLLDKVYQLRFFELPRFKQELFRELQGTVTISQDNWLETIQNALDREIKFELGSKDRRRAHLVEQQEKEIMLYKKIEKQLSDDPNLVYYSYQYIRFQLNSLKNRWAFWLDSMSESINMIDKKKIIEKFNEFQLTIENDLQENHFRKLVLEPNQTHQLTDFENFRKDNIDQIINFICIEHFLGADRIEQIANTFELIHAAANPLTTKTQYADTLTIFLADALIDMKQINMDPKNVYSENGDGRSLQQMYHLYGDKVKTYVDKNGKIYVRRTISREYYRSIRGDKAAGPHEQQKIDTILGCVVTKNESINNEQIRTLSRPNGSAITFLIRDNGDGIKHAELLIDGESITMNNKSQNKNDCYYNVVLIANEIFQGKSFEDAMKIFDNENVVKNLRENVSLAIKNDETLLNEFRWTNRTDIQVHYNSLVGLYKDNDGFIWNPNNLVPGPTKDRDLDPKSKIDKELLKHLSPEYTTLASGPSNMFDKLTQLRSKDIGKATWEKRANGKFYFKPNSSDPSNVYDFPSHDQSSKS
ncbi:unnamed protein product, partial [Didymodactylos carnosus]